MNELFPFEDSTSYELEDCRHWLNVYGELQATVDQFIGRNDAGGEDADLLRAHSERIKLRMLFWRARIDVLSGRPTPMPADLVLVAGDDGRFLDANQPALDLLGLGLAELTRLTVPDLFPPEARAEGRHHWREFVERGWDSGFFELKVPAGTSVQLVYRAVTNVEPGRHVSYLTPLEPPIAS